MIKPFAAPLAAFAFSLLVAFAPLKIVTPAAQAADETIVKVKSGESVAKTMDKLEAAVTKAGATVFARIDHAGGAMKAGMELGDEELLIFGNPKLGTPAMKHDPLAGLFLPMRVLAYSDKDGQTWLAYEDPAKMFNGLEIPADAEYLKKMQGALGKLTGMAAGQ